MTNPKSIGIVTAIEANQFRATTICHDGTHAVLSFPMELLDQGTIGTEFVMTREPLKTRILGPEELAEKKGKTLKELGQWTQTLRV